jgi:toxin-antitoxin system PIN domain toxin
MSEFLVFLADVNVYVAAFREDASAHTAALAWLDQRFQDDALFGNSEPVLSALIRLTTNPRVFRDAAPTEQALAFAEAVRARPNARSVAPGERHWPIFARLCAQPGVRGDLVPDAYLAALAIESACELVTLDRDFARFPGLRWNLLTI